MANKSIVILQSNYIPWKGYFDLMAACDEFILYDDVQFTKNDWRNRNQIKTPRGLEWLSIPVGTDLNRRVRDVMINDITWPQRHWDKLLQTYRSAPHFKEAAALLEPLYQRSHTNLSDTNRLFLETIRDFLGIRTPLRWSWDYQLSEGKTERLVDLCRQAGATTYISGPAAKDYLDESLFIAQGIEVRWFDYANYPEYPQLYPPFAHGVSMVDLLFNCGKNAPQFMKLGRR